MKWRLLAVRDRDRNDAGTVNEFGGKVKSSQKTAVSDINRSFGSSEIIWANRENERIIVGDICSSLSVFAWGESHA